MRLIHALIALVPLAALAVLQNFYYWQNLPERVATHFGPEGIADGWMSRTAACVVMGAFQILMPLLFLGIGYLLYWIPESMINIPNKPFWFHPDRKQASLSALAGMLGVFAIALSAFFFGMNHLTYLANLSEGRLAMVPFWVLLGLFLSFTAGWVGWMMIRFKVPASVR